MSTPSILSSNGTAFEVAPTGVQHQLNQTTPDAPNAKIFAMLELGLQQLKYRKKGLLHEIQSQTHRSVREQLQKQYQKKFQSAAVSRIDAAERHLQTGGPPSGVIDVSADCISLWRLPSVTFPFQRR